MVSGQLTRTYQPRFLCENLHKPGQAQGASMYADKIRTADIPALRLEPREAVALMCFIGVAAYLLGFFVGMMR